MNETILNWKQAAIAWGEGKEIEVLDNNFNVWLKFGTERQLFFIKDMNYRIKPQAEEKNPRYTWCSGYIYKNSMEISLHDVCENLNSLHEENEALKEELRHVNNERDLFAIKVSDLKRENQRLRSLHAFPWDSGSKASNDKQSTPTEKTDNIPHSFASLNDRIERVENKLIQHGIY